MTTWAGMALRMLVEAILPRVVLCFTTRRETQCGRSISKLMTQNSVPTPIYTLPLYRSRRPCHSKPFSAIPLFLGPTELSSSLSLHTQ